MSTSVSSCGVERWAMQAKELLVSKVPSWQEKCSDATDVPDTVVTMIEGMKAVTPQPSPSLPHGGNHIRVSHIHIQYPYQQSEPYQYTV